MSESPLPTSTGKIDADQALDTVPPTKVIDTTAPQPLPAEQLIEQACGEFKSQWSQGKAQRPRIQAFLADVPAPIAGRMFSQLLRLELDLLVDGRELPDEITYVSALSGYRSSIEQEFRQRRFANLFLGRKLGSGGMGCVYKALHPTLNRVVAVKVIQPQRIDDSQARERFFQEIKACGALEHPHVVQVSDANHVDGNYYLVMEFIDGFDLGRLCGRVSAPDACELIRQAADGLDCLHQNGFVHRDIKPSNLMLSHKGVCKLLDLGLVHVGDRVLTAGEGVLLGTVPYMSPEQCKNPRRVDIRSDIYSLGCTFYHLLTGRVPYGPPEFEGYFTIMSAHADQPIPQIRRVKPDVDERIEAVTKRMMAKNPVDRFQTPADLAAALAPLAVGSDLKRLGSPAGPAAAGPAASSASPIADTSPAAAASTSEKVSPLVRPMSKGLALLLGRPGQRRWRMVVAVAALVCIAFGLVQLMKTPLRRELDASFAALPALNGDWWFDDMPWFIPSARRELATTLVADRENGVAITDANRRDAHAARSYEPPVARLTKGLWSDDVRDFGDVLKGSITDLYNDPAIEKRESHLFFRCASILESDDPDGVLSQLGRVRALLDESITQVTADENPAAAGRDQAAWWHNLPIDATQCHLMALVLHKLALETQTADAAAEDPAKPHADVEAVWRQSEAAYTGAIQKYELQRQDPVARSLWALCIADLARMHLDRGNAEEARPWLMEATGSTAAKNLPPFHIYLLLIYAEADQQQAAWPAVRDHLQEAEELADQSALPASHPLRAAILQHQAWLAMDMNLPDQAKDYFQRANKIQQQHVERDPRAKVFQYHNRHGLAVSAAMKGIDEDGQHSPADREKATREALQLFDEVVNDMATDLEDPFVVGKHRQNLLDRALNSLGRQADCLFFGLPHEYGKAAEKYDAAFHFARDQGMDQRRNAEAITLLLYKGALARALAGDHSQARAKLMEADRAYDALASSGKSNLNLVKQIAEAGVNWTATADPLSQVRLEVKRLVARRQADGPKLQRDQRQPLAILLEHNADKSGLAELAGLKR